MRFLSNFFLLVLSTFLILSCSIIDLSKLNISTSISDENIIEKNASITLKFSENIADSSVPAKIKVGDYFTSFLFRN